MPLPANQLQLLSQMLYTSGKAYCVARKKKPTDADCPDINCLSAVQGFRNFVGYKDGVYNSNNKSIQDIKQYFARRDTGSFYRKAMEDNGWGNTIRLPAYMQTVIDVWAEDLVANNSLEEKSEVDKLKEQLAKLTNELETRSIIAESLSGFGFDTASRMSLSGAAVVNTAKDDGLNTLIQSIFSKKRAAIYLEIVKAYYLLAPNRVADKTAFAMLLEGFLLSLMPGCTGETDADNFINSLLLSDTPAYVKQQVSSFQAKYSAEDDKPKILTEQAVSGIKFALEKRPSILPNTRLRAAYSKGFQDAFKKDEKVRADDSRPQSTKSSPTQPSAVPAAASKSSGPEVPGAPMPTIGLAVAADAKRPLQPTASANAKYGSNGNGNLMLNAGVNSSVKTSIAVSAHAGLLAVAADGTHIAPTAAPPAAQLS